MKKSTPQPAPKSARSLLPVEEEPAFDVGLEEAPGHGNGANVNAMAAAEPDDEPLPFLEAASNDLSSDPMDDATAGPPDDLPFWSELEGQFGEPLDDIDVYLGRKQALDRLGANAAAGDGAIAFASPSPDKRQVAHEVTHIIQARGGTAGGDKSVSETGDSSEVEAQTVAARVAAGQPAGPITAGPSAAVHRDASGLKPDGETWKIGNKEYLVLPDEVFTARENELDANKTLSETDYRKKLGDYHTEQGKKLIAALGAIDSQAANKPLYDLHNYDADIKALVDAAGPEVRRYAWQYMRDNALQFQNVELAKKLVKLTDPISTLLGYLTSDTGSVRTLVSVRDWAAVNGAEHCLRARGMGDVQVGLKKSLGDLAPLGILYLMNAGKEDTTAAGAITEAFAYKNSEDFLKGWERLKVENPELAYAKLSEAVFLEDVRTRVKDANAKVLQDVANWKPPSQTPEPTGPQGPLTPDQLNAQANTTQYRALAVGVAGKLTTNAISALKGDLNANAFWQQALTQVQTMRAEVSRISGADTTTKEGRISASTAIAEGMSLVRMALGPGGAMLALAATDSAVGETVVGMIGGSQHDVRKDILRQLEWDKLSGAQAQRATLLTDDVADQLYKMVAKGNTDKLHSVLVGFNTAVLYMVTYENSGAGFRKGDNEADWAVSERRRRVHGMLDAAYQKRTAMSLSSLVTIAGSSQTENVYNGGRAEKELADDEYTAELTALDGRKLATLFSEFNTTLKPIFDAKDREHPGLKVSMGSGYKLKLTPKRAWLSSQLGRLKQRAKVVLKPAESDGKTLVMWEQKTAKAMESFESQFESKVGSLRRAFRDGDGDGSHEQSGLMLLNDQADGTQALMEGALGKAGADATQVQAFLQRFQTQIKGLASSLYSELKGAIIKKEDPSKNQWASLGLRSSGSMIPRAALQDHAVSDDKILKLAKRFGSMQAQYLDKVPNAEAGEARKFLTTAFAPLGGDMRPLIVAGLGRDNGSEALGLLGMHYRNFVSDETDSAESALALDVIEDPTKKREEEYTDFADRVGFRAVQISKALTELEGDPSSPDRVRSFIAIQGSLRVLIQRAAIAVDGVKMIRKLWLEKLGISMENDLGAHLSGWERGAVLLIPLGLTSLGRERDLSKADADDGWGFDVDVRGSDTFRDDYRIRTNSVDPDFSLDKATTRAMELYRLAGKLPGSHEDMMKAVGGENGYPEESRVVLEIFTKRYGFDLKFRLRQTFPDEPDQVERYAGMAQSAGGLGLGGEAVERSFYGDKKTLMRVALQASPKERQALLGDVAKLGQIRAQLGAKDYAHFHKTLNGNTDIYEIVRNQGGKEVTTHIRAYFDGRRAHWNNDPTLRKQAGRDREKLKKLVDAKIRAEASKAYADPAFQKVVADKHGSKERGFNVRAAVLGGGKASGLDQAMSNTWGSGTDESGLKSETRALTDEERKRARNDPMYQARVASDLLEGGNDDKDARQFFADLYTNSDSKGQGDLHAAEKQTMDGLTVVTDVAIDQDKALEAIYGMSIAELTALQSDPGKFLNLAGKLDAKHLARLRTYIAETNTIRDTHQASGDKIAEDRNKKLLIARYTARFIAVNPSNKEMFHVASQWFNERGLIPSEKKGQAPIPTFGDDEKREVYNRIKDKVKHNKAFAAIKEAVDNKVDPANAYLDVAFENKDSQDHILKAIDNASPATVLTEWSNVLQDGPTDGDRSLKAKFDAYLAAKTRLKDEPNSISKDAFDMAKHRFRDHRLDLSGAYLGKLQNGWGDMKFANRMASWPGAKEIPDNPSKKRLLAMKEHSRKRIWALNIDDVAPKVGLIAPSDLPKDATKKEKDDHAAKQRDYMANSQLLLSEDRTARSEMSHRKEVFDYNRGSGRGSGAAEEGRLVDLNYMVLKGELGASIGNDGQLDEHELTKIKDRADDFDNSVKEYKEAKAKLAALLSFIIKAIIIAVATVVTGGAAGVLATMLMSAGGVVVDNLIQQEILGKNDHSWENIGTDIFKALAIDVFTLGIGKGIKAGAAGLKVSGKLAKITSFEEGLRKSAQGNFKGMLINTAYESGKSVVTAPLDTLSDWAVDLATSNESKWGMHDWKSYASSSLGTKWGQMTDGFKGDLVGILASNLVGYGRNKLSGKSEELLAGIDIPSGQRPKTTSVLRSAAKYVKSDALGDGLEALTATALETVAMSVVNDTGMSYDDVYWILAKAGKKTLDKGAGTVAGTVNDNRTQKIMDQHKGHKWTDPALSEHYRHYVSEAKFGLGGKTPDDPAKWEAAYSAKYLKNVPKGAKDPYRAWVLEDPNQIAARSATSKADFDKQFSAGKDKADALRKVAADKLSSPTERAWYKAMLSDTTVRLKLAKGLKNPYDLSDDASVAAYRKALLNTMRHAMIERSSGLVDTWPEAKRKAWYTQINASSSDDLKGFSPHRTEASVAGTLKHARKWGDSFDKSQPTTSTNGPKTYKGTAPSANEPQPVPKSNSKNATPQNNTGGPPPAQPPPIPQTKLKGEKAHLEDGEWTVQHQSGDYFTLERIGPDGVRQRRKVHKLQLSASNRNDHLIPTIDLPTDTVMDVGGDSNSTQRAYSQMLNDDPMREAAIYVNTVTGRMIAIQGDSGTVTVGNGQAPHDASDPSQPWKVVLPQASKDAGAWVLKYHYHPNEPGQNRAAWLSRFPSDGQADMGTAWYGARETGKPYRSVIDYQMPWGRTRTTFGHDPTTDIYWVDMPVGYDNATGQEKRQRFDHQGIEKYHEWLELNGGVRRTAPSHMVPNASAAAGAGNPAAPNRPAQKTARILADDHPSKHADWKTWSQEKRGYVEDYLGAVDTTVLSHDDLSARFDRGFRMVGGKDTKVIDNALPRAPKATPKDGSQESTQWDGVEGHDAKFQHMRAGAMAQSRADYLEIARQAKKDGDLDTAKKYSKASKDAAEQMGSAAARAYMGTSAKYKGFTELDTTIDGANTLDHIYVRGDEVIVVEAKGGNSGLGWRQNADGTKMVQQGTPEYLEAIMKQMKRRGQTPDADDTLDVDEDHAFLKVQQAYLTGKLRYVVVSQAADEHGNLADIDSKEYPVK